MVDTQVMEVLTGASMDQLLTPSSLDIGIAAPSWYLCSVGLGRQRRKEHERRVITLSRNLILGFWTRRNSRGRERALPDENT